MKCRQCGNSFSSGMVCPLCGHKNIGQIHCPVCGKVIHYGQGHCSSCGTPTQYCKRVEVVVKGDVIDYTTHSDESHTYDTKEQYDYKKNAYQYDQSETKETTKQPYLTSNNDKQYTSIKNKTRDAHPYKEQYDYKKDAYQYDQKQTDKKKDYLSSFIQTIKEKQGEMQKEVFNKNTQSSKTPNFFGSTIGGIILVVVIIGFCFSAILSEDSESEYVSYPSVANSEMAELPIVGTNNNLIKQANYSNGQWASLYGEEVYITSGPVFAFDKSFGAQAIMHEEVFQYIYRDESTVCYLDDYGLLWYWDIETDDQWVISEDVSEAVYLDGSLYYLRQDDNKALYQYTIATDVSTVITREYHSCLRVDETTNKLYYWDINSKLVGVSNLTQTRVYDTYELPMTNYYVEGNKVYTYQDEYGFSVYDLTSQQVISTIPYVDVKQFVRVTDGYLCLLSGGNVSKVYDDGSSKLIIQKDVNFLQIQVVGDKFLLKDEYNEEIFLYIGSESGDLAQIYF